MMPVADAIVAVLGKGHVLPEADVSGGQVLLRAWC